MKYQNVILTQHFTLQDENKDQETPSFPCLVIWRRLDNVQIKQTSNHICNAVKYCVKTCYLNGKIHNGSEYRDHTCFFMHYHLPGPEDAV